MAGKFEGADLIELKKFEGADLIELKECDEVGAGKTKQKHKHGVREAKSGGSGFVPGKKFASSSFRSGGRGVGKVEKTTTRGEWKKLRDMRREIVEKHQMILANKTAEEIQLERAVFGGSDRIVESLEKLSRKRSGAPKSELEDEEEDDDAKEEAEEAEAESEGEGDGDDEGDTDAEPTVPTPKKKAKAPVWVDEDDEKIRIKDVAESYARGKHRRLINNRDSYKKFAEKRFANVYGATPNWARVPTAEEREADDPMLMKTGVYVKGSSGALGSGNLTMKKLSDLNAQGCGVEGAYLTSVEFHPWSQVALVAGSTNTVSIYQVDGADNSKLQSVRFERGPVRSARFSQDGNEIFVGLTKYCKQFHTYDMLTSEVKTHSWPAKRAEPNWQTMEVCPQGRFVVGLGLRRSEVNFMSAKTKEWIDTVHLSDKVRAYRFTPDGDYLLATGEGGQIHVIDARSRQCCNRVNDEGSLLGTSLALSPDGALLAVGNSSGIVNVYEASSILGAVMDADVMPTRSIMNLVTSITSLKFNHSSDILAMASSEKDNACRLWHVKSRSTFSNFPLPTAKFRKVKALDFSLHSGFFALGNDAGRVNLYRLPFFKEF